MNLYAIPGELIRLGGGNPGALRPRPKDRATGLSCFDSLQSLAAYYDSIGRPLEPGTEYVLLDTSKFGPELEVEPDASIPGHYLVRPTQPGKLDEWIDRVAEVHPLTQRLIDSIIKDSKGNKRRTTP